MNVISPASSDVPLKLVAVPLIEVETLMLKMINGGIYNTEKSVPVTVVASTYHLQSGGQRVRARLALQSGSAMGLAPKDSVALAAAAELVHNASLVHDDLHDREKLRRGTQTVWVAYGDEVAICAGDSTPFFPASATANRSFNGLHPKSKFLAFILPPPFSPATPFFPASGPANRSFNGLHPKSKFLAFSLTRATSISKACLALAMASPPASISAPDICSP